MIKRKENNWSKPILRVAEQLEQVVSPSVCWEGASAKAGENPDFQETKSLSNWIKLEKNQKLESPAGWFRATISVPEKIAGFETIGKFLRLLIDTRGLSTVFVDGEKKGEVFLRGYCPLTKITKLNQKIECLVYVNLMLGNAGISEAHLQLDNQPEIFTEIQNFATSLMTGVHLLSRESLRKGLYVQQRSRVNRLNDFDKIKKLRSLLLEAALLMDVELLNAGKPDKFKLCLDKAQKICRPVARYAKEYTVYLIGHSHIDLAWKWRWNEAIESSRQTFSNQLNLLKKYPDYVFTESSAVVWEVIAQKYPGLFKKIRQAVAKNQWELVGGTWCEIDSNLVDGESWVRHFLYSNDFIRKHFNRKFRAGWNIDAFGFNANLPQLYSQAGITTFLTQKLRYNDSQLFPHIIFWWQSADGSRILGIHAIPDHYQEIIPQEIAQTVNEFAVNTSLKDVILLFGIGNHGGGPMPEMFRRFKECEKLFIFPKIKFSSLDGYVKILRKKYDLSRLPVWRNELYLETHRKTYTTHSDIKRWNRQSELLLNNVEKLQALAKIFVPNFKPPDLEQAWKKVLFNQFHDVLAGTSIPSVYQDVRENYEYSQKTVMQTTQECLRLLSDNINMESLAAGGVPFIVFNPLGWKRDDFVRLESPYSQRDCEVLDDTGNIVSSQITSDCGKPELLFMAKDAPALGYRTYVVRKAENKQRQNIVHNKLIAAKSRLENNFFRILIDEKTGNIRNIFDKINRKEVLARGEMGNVLQLLEDKPQVYATWNFGFTGRMCELNKVEKIELIEKGPVRAVLRIHRSYAGDWKKKYYNMYLWKSPGSDYATSFFTQDIIIYNDIARIDFRLKADWWEENKVLKVVFPLSVHSSEATYEIPFGTIRRPAHSRTVYAKARYEVSAIRWADLSDKNYGVSLLNRDKYGYDTKDNTMRLTLLVGSASDDPNQVPDPLADRGIQECFYSLYPHKGNWQPAETIHKGLEYNTPFITEQIKYSRGSLPACFGAVEIEPSNLVLSSFKPAYDGRGYILRVYETCGRKTSAEIKCNFPITRAVRCNLLEEKEKSLPIDSSNVIKTDIAPYRITTIRII